MCDTCEYCYGTGVREVTEPNPYGITSAICSCQSLQLSEEELDELLAMMEATK